MATHNSKIWKSQDFAQEQPASQKNPPTHHEDCCNVGDFYSGGMFLRVNCSSVKAGRGLQPESNGKGGSLRRSVPRLQTLGDIL